MIPSFTSEIKIIVIGNTFTGKTSFVKKWTGGHFTDAYKATIVSEFGYKLININKRIYRIQLWDWAGQDRNTYIASLFCKDCLGVIIIADATDHSTLLDSIKWKTIIMEKAKFVNGEDLPILLIQNKIDLIQSPEESEAEVKEFCDSNSFIGYFRASAKTGKNINEAMNYLLNHVINKLDKYESIKGIHAPDDKNKNINLNPNYPRKEDINEYNPGKNTGRCC